MGCGEIEPLDALDHVLGLLDEDADAGVREHLASCDECRAEAGEFMVVGDRLRALGEITRVKGREGFADRTRDDVRKAMGGSAVLGQTSSWRIVHTGESQRLMRAAVRRRRATARALKIAAAVLLFLGGGLALAWHLLGDGLVDRYGEAVERAFDVDLAEWGLRPEAGKLAERARGAPSADELRSLAGEIERLVRRELFSASPRAGSVVLLELAVSVARDGAADGSALVAAAIEEAALVPADGTPPDAGEVSLLRKARGLWREGRNDRAREALLLSAVEGSPLALYYSGLAAADGGAAQEAAEKLERAAEKVPAVWIVLAWRWLREEKPSKARAAFEKAPAGALRDALRDALGQGR